MVKAGWKPFSSGHDSNSKSRDQQILFVDAINTLEQLSRKKIIYQSTKASLRFEGMKRRLERRQP